MAVIDSLRSTWQTSNVDGDFLRKRLLFSLGIDSPFPNLSFASKKTSPSINARHQLDMKSLTRHLAPKISNSLSSMESYSVPLKFGLDIDCLPPAQFMFPQPPASINVLNPVTPRTKKSVKFNNDVAVRPIPSRHSYSPRVKARLYTAPRELAASAVRNAVEFNYEGCSYRNVVEENGMYVCVESGELIHPAHVHKILKIRPN
mmetsp:Transcript_31674/g.67100  ORF Transcript_31674/g.67100 Transcript_31674/m.67100 type:complete len:203 (+) Transcript_31674:365-973(+)|eukprot:CAMPEP_0171345816 /NCGR_PEP_ID=MMETSP0878-20121228/22637_1 /TAXON_ID=67004 /ORGANISM="Thalassiosira weissflogii, Strain CCMP1336" /LENGTH=202 /DNA_ID=CAMNT_0011849331 /DNA_START=313 /DNA_END=921 /DNA_ORIENTATION=+